MLVTIENSGRPMSNTSYHKRCTKGQKNWWLKGPSGFVEIGDHRGDKDISIEVDLEPGTYTLGCGPNDGHGCREKIVVTAGSTEFPGVYPTPIKREDGCKVGWLYYATEADANKAAEIAKAEANRKAKQGYDFGYQTPGQITHANGHYIVVVP